MKILSYCWKQFSGLLFYEKEKYKLFCLFSGQLNYFCGCSDVFLYDVKRHLQINQPIISINTKRRETYNVWINIVIEKFAAIFHWPESAGSRKKMVRHEQEKELGINRFFMLSHSLLFSSSQNLAAWLPWWFCYILNYVCKLPKWRLNFTFKHFFFLDLMTISN